MTQPRHTWILLALLVLALLADVGVRRSLATADAPLPDWPGFALGEPDALVLTRQEVVIRLARDPDGTWRVEEPFADRADQGAVIALLNAVRRGELLEARVDSDPEAYGTYGLSGIDPVRVAVRAGDDTLAELYIGSDGPGKTTFVRVPGSEDVFRARLGGRALADRPPGAWRDRTLLSLAPEDILGLSLTGRVDVALVRSSGLDGAGGWTMEGRPDLPLDEPSVDAVVGAFAQLEALEVLPAAPAELDRPDLTVTLMLADGTEVFRFAVVRGQAFGLRERDGRAFRVSANLLSALLRPPTAWRDRALLRLDPTRLTALVLLEGDRETELGRGDTGWEVVRPLGVDVDPALAAQAVRYLATLEVEGWAIVGAAEAGFPSPTRVILRGDGERVLEIGAPVPDRPPGGEARFVRMADAPEQIGALSARTWSALRRAWAR